MDLSSVRIREHFGLVTNDTHTGQFSFLVSPPKNRGSVEKQDYILIDHPLLGESCQILAIIKEIASYEEVSGSTIGDKMGKMLATAEIIGFIDLRSEVRPLHKVLVPPNPGTRVYVPLVRFLEDTFKRDVRGVPFVAPIELGMFEFSTAENMDTGAIKCFIDAQELTTKHTIIAAMTGAGKTHTAKVIVQELASKTKIPIVIVDHTGEYTNLQHTENQVTILAARPEKAKKTQTRKVPIKSINEKNEKETLAKEVKQGQIIILNGQGLTAEERRTFFTNSLKTLWKNRTEETTEPFFLLIEEAENLKGETLDQIITEGRKNGISICLVSIHPTELGGRVLSQIANQIIGKTTDKEDIEYLTNMEGSVNGGLPNLAVGEWIINGINMARSMKIKVRELAPSI